LLVELLENDERLRELDALDRDALERDDDSLDREEESLDGDVFDLVDDDNVVDRGGATFPPV